MARKKGLSWSELANTSVGKFNSHKVAELWSSSKPKKVSKYGNKKVVINGIKFDSQGEGDRYLQLKAFERAGKIKNLVLQKKYTLVPKMKAEDGSTIRALVYIADFVYFNNITGREVVEDFKGRRTRTFIDKKKQMMHVHNIEIYETGFKHLKECRL